ncbi:hypothetical protein QQP08_005825 [Theobroma cacao]|nr:hypothetical protein QQP08_005825 [Theobroma cacao]
MQLRSRRIPLQLKMDGKCFWILLSNVLTASKLTPSTSTILTIITATVKFCSEATTSSTVGVSWLICIDGKSKTSRRVASKPIDHS